LVLALSGNRTRSIQIDERLLINNGSINNSLLKNNKENNTIGQKKRKMFVFIFKFLFNPNIV